MPAEETTAFLTRSPHSAYSQASPVASLIPPRTSDRIRPYTSYSREPAHSAPVALSQAIPTALSSTVSSVLVPFAPSCITTIQSRKREGVTLLFSYSLSWHYRVVRETRRYLGFRGTRPLPLH